MYKILPILLFAYGFAVTTDDIYDNSYALIIGIDKYENVRSLDYAVKDAVDIQSMLVDKFHFKEDNIVLLKDEEATQASILQEFSNITKKANDNDRVLIFNNVASSFIRSLTLSLGKSNVLTNIS